MTNDDSFNVCCLVLDHWCGFAVDRCSESALGKGCISRMGSDVLCKCKINEAFQFLFLRNAQVLASVSC